MLKSNSPLKKATGSEPHASNTDKNGTRRGACTLFQRAANLRCLWLTVFIISLTSCQDPAYKAKQAVRNAYIDRNAMLHLSRERAGPEHLEALAELDQEMRRRYADRLEKTIKLVNERWRYDNNRWIKMRPVREEHIRRMLEGKPEDIPDAWRKMTY